MLRTKLFLCSNLIAVTILSINLLLLLDSFFVLFKLFFQFHNCSKFLISSPMEILASFTFISSYIDEERSSHWEFF